MPEDLTKHTRRAHRAMLRASAADDKAALQKVQQDLYNPSGYLSKLTEGPSPECMVPMVDSLLMASYNNSRSVDAELRHNLASVGRTFGLDQKRYDSITGAADLAATVKGSAKPRAVIERVSNLLERASFGKDAGLTMIKALEDKHL